MPEHCPGCHGNVYHPSLPEEPYCPGCGHEALLIGKDRIIAALQHRVEVLEQEGDSRVAVRDAELARLRNSNEHWHTRVTQLLNDNAELQRKLEIHGPNGGTPKNESR